MPIPDLFPQWLLDASAPFVALGWLLILATPVACVVIFAIAAFRSGVSTILAPNNGVAGDDVD